MAWREEKRIRLLAMFANSFNTGPQGHVRAAAVARYAAEPVRYNARNSLAVNPANGSDALKTGGQCPMDGLCAGSNIPGYHS